MRVRILLFVNVQLEAILPGGYIFSLLIVPPKWKLHVHLIMTLSFPVSRFRISYHLLAFVWYGLPCALAYWGYCFQPIVFCSGSKIIQSL